MIINLLGYTIEINIGKTDTLLAEKLLKLYRNYHYGNSPKIGLIKAARENSHNQLGLYEAKELVENLFDFNEANEVIIR